MREKLLEQMRVAKRAYDRLLEQALKLGEKAFSSIDDTDVFNMFRIAAILHGMEFLVKRIRMHKAKIDPRVFRALRALGKKQGVLIPKGASDQVRRVAVDLVRKSGPAVLLVHGWGGRAAFHPVFQQGDLLLRQGRLRRHRQGDAGLRDAVHDHHDGVDRPAHAQRVHR